MGDDFDLFPKRENLDPFSFGKKEKSAEKDKPDGGEELFGQKEAEGGTLPDLPIDLSQGIPESPPDQLPDLPLGSPVDIPPAPEPVTPSVPSTEMPGGEPFSEPRAETSDPTPPVTDAPPDTLDSILSDGPISDEKTFDEPVLEQEEIVEEKGRKGSSKSPSPFIVVGGALVIIIGLLYGALTYLKRDKAPVPVKTLPAVSVQVPAPTPKPTPAPGSEAAQAEEPAEVQEEAGTQAAEDTGQPGAVVAKPGAPSDNSQTTDSASVKVEDKPETAAAVEAPSAQATQVAQAGGVQYSVQVGAFILDSSVKELERKLQGLGYESFQKKGSTTAMMNMLTVGPFSRVEDARTALSRLTSAGIDSNLRRRNDGGAIINAGSYLLKENADSVSSKIRSLGYPVKLSKNEARLPMTFVRVGRYSGVDDAARIRDKLKREGLEGIVVKLQ